MVLPNLKHLSAFPPLSLPRSGKQGLIFLGETYRVYVSLHNESQQLVTDIVLKVCMCVCVCVRERKRESSLLASGGGDHSIQSAAADAVCPHSQVGPQWTY